MIGDAEASCTGRDLLLLTETLVFSSKGVINQLLVNGI